MSHLVHQIGGVCQAKRAQILHLCPDHLGTPCDTRSLCSEARMGVNIGLRRTPNPYVAKPEPVAHLVPQIGGVCHAVGYHSQQGCPDHVYTRCTPRSLCSEARIGVHCAHRMYTKSLCSEARMVCTNQCRGWVSTRVLYQIPALAKTSDPYVAKPESGCVPKWSIWV